ncbi:MAG: hypothetical protein WAM94_00820, partial [Chromatiaceae bacterium]
IPVSGAWAAHRSEADQAIAAAKAAHEKAAAAGGASAETATLIKQAEELIPSRQYTKAIELANQAMKQDAFAASQAAGGAGDSAPVDPGAKAGAEQAIADAEAARKKAATVGGEWRDTAKMIKEAQDLVKSGEYDKAIKLANMAKRQGELGYAQSLAEKNAGFPSYMHAKK